MVVDAVEEQSEAAVDAIRRALADAEIVGLYLYGSAVAGGLRPDSDLDLFVVTDRRLTTDEKARIVAGLLPVSGRKTRPPEWRPLEVTVVAQPKVRPWHYPPRVELQFGEWLRDSFLSGAVEPEPAETPGSRRADHDGAAERQGAHRSGGDRPSRRCSAGRPRARHARWRAVPDGRPRRRHSQRPPTLARIWTTVATGRTGPRTRPPSGSCHGCPSHRPTLARCRALSRGWIRRSMGRGRGPPARRPPRQRDHRRGWARRPRCDDRQSSGPER